jgi:hypothetical protein
VFARDVVRLIARIREQDALIRELAVLLRHRSIPTCSCQVCIRAPGLLAAEPLTERKEGG